MALSERQERSRRSSVHKASLIEDGARVEGTIKRLVRDRGFGFITASDGTEYFFHRSEAIDFEGLNEKDPVEFIKGHSEKGPRAHKVELAG